MYLMHRKYSIFNKKKENDIVKIKKKRNISVLNWTLTIKKKVFTLLYDRL